MIEFKKPWEPLLKEQSKKIEQELKNEISRKHKLYGKIVNAIAKRIDSDDYLFTVNNKEFAVVHLTFSSHPETDPQWPYTIIYKNEEEFIKKCLMPDYDEIENKEI